MPQLQTSHAVEDIGILFEINWKLLISQGLSGEIGKNGLPGEPVCLLEFNSIMDKSFSFVMKIMRFFTKGSPGKDGPKGLKGVRGLTVWNEDWRMFILCIVIVDTH